MMISFGRSMGQAGAAGGAATSARTNLINSSGDLTTAFWARTNVSAPVAVADYEGGLKAYEVRATASAAANFTTSSGNVTIVRAGNHVLSFIAKQGSGATDGNRWGLFNITSAALLFSGTINYGTGALTSFLAGSTATSLGSGWWFVSVPVPSLTAGHVFRLYACFAGAAETANEYGIVFGPMMEYGTNAQVKRVLT